MQSFRHLFLTILLLLAPLSSAHAEQYLTIGAGWFNFDDNGNGKESANFAGEWRGNKFFYGLLPVVGVNVNTQGGVYGYGGLNYDLELTPNWIVTPGVAVGAWHRGSSEDLGGTLEFHESLEVDYKFDNGGYRLGAQISHTSNADVYDYNPGANSLLGTFSVPLSR